MREQLKRRASELYNSRQFAAAKDLYLQICEQYPEDAEAWFLLGVINSVLGDTQETVRCTTRSLQLAPNNPHALNILAQAHIALQQYPEVITSYQALLKMNPDYAVALDNIGLALQKMGRPRDAIEYHRKALRLSPGEAGWWKNLGNAQHSARDLDSAYTSFRQALSIKPTMAEPHFSMSAIHTERLELEQAEQSLRQGLQYQPDSAKSHLNLSFILLLSKQMKEGWKEYEWRLKHLGLNERHFDSPRWDGSPLNDRSIYLFTEQGVGDSIQFIRYVPILKEMGVQVILECHQPLKRLFTTMSAVDKLVVKGYQIPKHDCHAALMSTPYLLGTTCDSIPSDIPYLSAAAGNRLLIKALETIANRHKVGLVWAGSPAHKNDARRSIPFAEFKQLISSGTIEFCSLQKGERSADLKTLDHQQRVTDLAPFLDDYADTAYTLADLDLLITVDTSVAHLAGALGRPVWLLLPWNPDFRWMLGRNDSPWYPSMQLFRQQQAGDWLGVIDRVRDTLHKKFTAADPSNRGQVTFN